MVMASKDQVRRQIPENISWEAEEYVIRDKNSWWYVGFGAFVIVLCAIAVLLQWWTFLIVILLGSVALILYIVRPPRMIHYSLTKKGLSEDKIFHSFDDFKSFGFLRENGHFAIVLTPRKRFSLRITVYFPESQGEVIIDALGLRLPMEEVHMDFLDRLIKFLRI